MSFRRSNYRNTCTVNLECMWIQIFRSADIGSVEADQKLGGKNQKEAIRSPTRSVPLSYLLVTVLESDELQDGN